MGRITELLNTAHARSQAQGWPYIGALLPHEAHELLQLAPGARLIDVRSRAELELTGTLPGAVHVEWQSWPGWVINPHFSVQLTQAVDPESLLFFILPQRPPLTSRRDRGHRSGLEALLQRTGRF